jgi:hypothetical protein
MTVEGIENVWFADLQMQKPHPEIVEWHLADWNTLRLGLRFAL